MSKQTINIGASPNDGTGTPLRTSFDYCNLNFTELYTATGPSGNNIVCPGTLTVSAGTVALPSLTTAGDTNTGIYFPAADTIAFTEGGAEAMRINSTGNLVVNNAATITGDLTAARLIVTGGTIPTNGLWLATTNTLEFAANSLAQYRIAPLGVFSWYDGAGGTRMTLNSTGLAIGDTAFSGTRLTLRESATNPNALAMTNRNATQTWRLSVDTAAVDDKILGFYDSTSTTFRMQLTDTGNLGLGVTPSAWGTMKAVQVLGASFVGDTTVNRARVISNAYYNGSDYVYLQNNFAGMYVQNAANGTHSWSIAPSGIAGNTITGVNAFVQAMTLDASGNLLVGKTSYGLAVGFAAVATGSVDSVMASAVSTQSTLNVYSTGAAAYRFYVGMNGTINATNTTISAISDARLKENVQDIDVGLGAILALKPRKFDWKAGKGKDIKGDRGFIAQEFEQVFPQLVDEWKDNAPEGEAPYKSVRQDLIPVLVKAIQELAAEVNALKNA